MKCLASAVINTFHILNIFHCLICLNRYLKNQLHMFCVRFFHRSLLILNFKIKIKMQQQHWFKVALNLFVALAWKH